MSRVVDPDVDLPDDVRAAIAVFGTPLRVAILRVLADKPLTTLQLVEELDVSSRGTLPRNLQILEAAGAIDGHPEHGARRGRTVRWELNAPRVTALSQALGAYLAGG